MTKSSIFVVLLFSSMTTFLKGADCPIIFVHGHTSEAVPEDDEDKTKGGWKTWYPTETDGITLKYPTAMTSIIDSHYGGYSAGDPLNCHKNTSLASTGGETRKIYNFSYYNPDGSRGAIGTNGRLWPTSEIQRWIYEQNINNACWAEHLANFIDKVLVATGATKVDIVAHSMGGLVAHSAIKYYGCANKVRKLLMIGTPNHGFDCYLEWFYNWYSKDQWWQWNGEDIEMNVGSKDWYFVDEGTGETGIWCDLLGYGNEGVQISTIAGNRKTGFGSLVPDPNDGTVKVSWVKMGNSADFEPTIYASHSYDGEPEIALTTCTYTTEFIKNWIIDDDTSHNGASVAGAFEAYDSIPINEKWNGYELRLSLPVDDYNKTLTVLTRCWAEGWDSGGSVSLPLGYKAFPLYKYYKGTPGDPVFSADPTSYIIGGFENHYCLRMKSWVYGMDGLISEKTDSISIFYDDLPDKCDVEVVSPGPDSVFTVQSAWDKLTVKVKCDFYTAQNFTVYFSPYEAGTLVPVWTETNYHGGGETKTIQFAMPQVNSPYCRVFVRAWLDNFTKEDFVSDYFTIQLSAPSELYCFEKDESKVGLDWKCGTILNFEVQRRLKGTTTWQVIAQGYWGPGSKTFYDTDVMRDTVYYYKVRSYGEFQGERFYSGFSNTDTVRTPKLNSPTALRVQAPASDRIVLEFRDRSNVETSFEVERKCPATGEPWHVITILPPEPNSGNWVTWHDDNVEPERTYFYRVRAYTSTSPAGYSGYTDVAGATVMPNLTTSHDSATAYQPKVIYDADNHLYWMGYSAESLVLASKSDDGIDWEGAITACYWGQELYEKDAGFCQIDVKENGRPVMVFSYRNRKLYNPNPLWWSSIHFAYFDPDSNDWVDSICLYRGNFLQDTAPPFYPFAFRLVGTVVHLIYVENYRLKYTTYDYAAPSGYIFGDTLDLGDASPSCYPVMDRDGAGNLYCAWLSYDGYSIYYRQRVNNVWSNIDSVPVPWITHIAHLSLKRINGKTHIVSTNQEPLGPGNTWEDFNLFYLVKDSTAWQTEYIVGDENNLAGAGQIITENLLLYHRRIDGNWDIYYQERADTGWAEPICVRNTPARSKFPQGVFDGENICLIWTEGDSPPYQIDTAKIRVIPELEVVYPTTAAILGSRLRAGLPLNIKWSSSDNVGVAFHRVYYSLDAGTTYTKIGDNLSGTTYELRWTVPDTVVTGLMIKVEAYDGAGMFCSKEVGPFTTTKELVFNPNFEEVSENKPYLWSNYGSGDVFEADWNGVQNGQFSAHMSRSASGDYFGFYQEKIPVEPNKRYWLQGYIKTEASAGNANLAFGVWHSHPDTNHHRDFGYISGNTDWIYVCDSLTTRPYEDTIRVMMFGNPAFVGDAWFDNLNLLIDTVLPQVIVSYPNGGESLLVEQKIQIYWWTSDNVKMGRIDSVLYSTDAGQSWQVIAVNLPATASSCEWTVPVWCQQYRIRVVASDASGNRSRDESDAVFGTKYFTFSGFEYTDPACFENVLVGGQGVIDAGAIKVSGYMNDVGPHTGRFMYKIWGTDTATAQNSYVIFKVFPYDFIVHDSTYFSFWLWVEDAPTDSGHICLDVVTKDGQILRAWNRYGYILDQTGQRIHPAFHSAPKGDWYQYVFTLQPAVGETIDYVVLIYDDYANSETGYFEGYIDDIEILDSFPIPDTWHCERFPVGADPLHNPNNYDPNFYMNFIAEADSVKLIIDPQGDGGEGAHWVAPTPGIRNDVTDIPVDENTMLYWEQYDKEHSLILGLLVHDNQNQNRWLYYAKNAYNHWWKEGWVNMVDSSQNYDTWEWFYRNIWNDYVAEYGQGVPPNSVEPEYIKELRLEHFAKSEWVNDHGGTIKNCFIGIDSIPPVVQVVQPNGGEKLEIGSIYSIIWKAKDTLQIGLQSIYYSTDGGATWQNVAENQQFEPIASYQYNWEVPAHPADECLVKVISKDIANNTGIDISDAQFSICWLTSYDSTATLGNGERIVYDSGKLHLVFTSGDSIFYSYSLTEGATWHPKQLIDLGRYPALAVDEFHRVHLVYIKENSLYYKEITGIQNPVSIYASSRVIQSPSFIVAADRGYLVFEEREYTGMDPVSHLMYGVYHIGVPPNGNFEVQEILCDSSEFLKNPHLAMFGDSRPQIVYEKSGEVWYVEGNLGQLKAADEDNWPSSTCPGARDRYNRDPSTRGEGIFKRGWAEPVMIGAGQNPKISVHKEIVDVVWERQGEIYHRKKWYYSEFSPIENISNSPNRISKNPIIFSPYLVLWLEEPGVPPDTKFDVILSIWQRDGWSEPIPVATNSQLAFAPKAFFDGNKIYCIYTYGNTGPYEIKSAKMSVDTILPYRTSKTKLATASNNAKRLVLDNAGVLHTFYQSGEYVFYNYETLKRVQGDNKNPLSPFTKGRTREIKEGSGEDRIFAQGRYPAASFNHDVMHTVWISGSVYPPHKLWYRKGIGEDWDEPVIIWSRPGSPEYRILPPSFATSNDSGFVVIEEEKIVGSILYWKLYYLAFPLAGSGDINITTIDSIQVATPPPWPPEEEPVSASIVLDDKDNPHIVWADKYGHIQYTYRNGTGFVEKEDLTAGYIGEIDAKKPCIDKYKNRLSVVFELFGDIYYTYKPIQGNLGWAELKNISNSSDSSNAPIILCGSQVFWSEKVGADYRIYGTSFNGFNWSVPHPIIPTPSSSEYYVQGVADIKGLFVPIYLVWTSGQGEAYNIVHTDVTAHIPNWQSGEVKDDTVWEGNVFVTGDVTVKENVKLTILPGTYVYFQYPDDQMGGNAIDRTELIVKGNLEAIGTEQDSIRFIVYPGDLFWYGLEFVESGTCNIGYSRVTNSFGGIYFYDASGAVHNSVIDSNSIGLYLYESKVTIKKNLIQHNHGTGISCEWSDVIIDSNLIYHNSVALDTLVRISRNQGISARNIRESGYQDRGDTISFSCTGINISNSQIEITNNRIIDNFRGLYTSGWIIGKVNGNLFDSNLFHGFDFVGDSLDIEICCNTFTNNGWYDWPVTELAGIYQGVFHYRPGTRIAIKNNKFYGNKVGYSCVKYYQETSERTPVEVSGNTIRDNELGVYANADKYANLELILTRNSILNNQTLQVYHAYRASQILNLGNLDNESTIDDGMNRIYATSGLSQYYMRNDTPDRIMAQGNYWESKDSATIDRRIYDDDENPGCGMVDFKYFATWGEIPPGTVWSGIVLVGGDVVVPEGVTLTIEPGTQVYFAAGIDGAQAGIDTTKAELIVYGEIESPKSQKLKAENSDCTDEQKTQITQNQCSGLIYQTHEEKQSSSKLLHSRNEYEKRNTNTIENDIPIYFTSDAYEPMPGDWYGIRFIKEKHLKSKIPEYLDMEKDQRIETLNPIRGNSSCLAIGLNSGQKRIIEGKRDGVKQEMKDWVIKYAECGLYFRSDKIEVKSCSLSNNSIGGVIDAEEFEIKESWFMDNNTGLMLENGEGEIKNNIICGNDTGMLIGMISGEVKENVIRNNGIGIYITEAAPTIGRENLFDHNTRYHIYNNTSDSIDATENYWYPSEQESIAFYIYDYYDDSRLGIVYFEPTAGEIVGGPQGAEGQISRPFFFENIYPNPTKGMIRLRFNSPDERKITIKLYDVCARLVYQEDITKSKIGMNEILIKQEGLSAGVYFVRIETIGYEKTEKAILLK